MVNTIWMISFLNVKSLQKFRNKNHVLVFNDFFQNLTFSLVYSAFFFLFDKLAAIVINKEEVIQTVKALDVKVPSFHPPIIW